jgi:hypothetical protein
MAIRRMVDKCHVGMVIDYSDDEEELIFCEQCQKQGTLSKLKQGVYLDMSGKLLVNPPPDAEDWLQCWKCGLIIPTKDAKKQGKISGIQGIEILQNPYDYGKSLILGNDSKNRYQRLKRRQNKHPDAEVQKLIDKGWQLTSYSTSTTMIPT